MSQAALSCVRCVMARSGCSLQLPETFCLPLARSVERFDAGRGGLVLRTRPLRSATRRTVATGSLAAAAIAVLLAGSVTSASAAPTGSRAAGQAGNTDAARVRAGGDAVAAPPRAKAGGGQEVGLSSTAVKSERARLSALRNDFKTW